MSVDMLEEKEYIAVAYVSINVDCVIFRCQKRLEEDGFFV